MLKYREVDSSNMSKPGKKMKSLTEAIMNRVSIRSYIDKPVAKAKKKAIEKFLNTYNRGPFGNVIRFELIDLSELSKSEKYELGTYGIIKGAPLYIAGAIKPAPYSMEDFGFCMEKIILNITKNGYGTCWMAGTFKRENFERRIGADVGEIVPGICPVGHFQEKKGLAIQLMEVMSETRKRKSPGELFFINDFNRPLNLEEAGPYKIALDSVWVAPSSSNKQPWRILKEPGEQTYHFYMKKTIGFGNITEDKHIQSIDMGVALCHFETAAKESGLPGGWEIQERKNRPPLEYIATWKANL